MRTYRRACPTLTGVVLCALLCAPAAAAEPLSLQHALRSAAGLDEDIASAEQELEAARADTATAASDLLPTVNVAASRSHANQEVVSGDVVLVKEDYWQADINVSTPLVDPSAIGGLVAADKERAAVRADLDLTLHEVLYGVVRAYYEALSAHSAIESARASAETAKVLEEAARSRLAAGTETVLGVDRARADRIAADGRVEQAVFAAEAADLQLAHAANMPLQSFELDPPDRPQLPVRDSDARVDLALGGRPDLLSARFAAHSARASMAAAALRFSPVLQLRWDWRYTDNTSFYGADYQERWFLRLEAEWTLPGILEPGASVARGKARRHQAVLAVERLERDLSLEVRTAELQLDAAEAALRVAQERDAVAQANLDAGMRLYQEGLATGLEVTTLKDDRDIAAAVLVVATLDRDLAEVDLLQVLGQDPMVAYGAEESP